MKRELYKETYKIMRLYKDINDNAIVTIEQLQDEYSDKVATGEIDEKEQTFSGYIRNCTTENGGTLEPLQYVIVNDVPIFGKFRIVTFFGKVVLHEFDGSGYGDMSPDIAIREVVAISAEDDYTIIEVF